MDDTNPNFPLPQSIPDANSVSPGPTPIPETSETYPLATDQTQTFTAIPDVDSEKPPKKSKKQLILDILLVLIVLLLGSTAVMAYSIAYEKIDIGDDDLQEKISNFVMGLPFTPKTPKYILGRMVMAQSEIEKHSFDISASVDAKDLLADLGLNKLDFAMIGKIDYSDPDNLTGEVQFDLTEGASMQLKKIDNSLYFNIKELPEFLLTLVGIDLAQISDVLNVWVLYDIGELESEARKDLDVYKQEVGDDEWTFDDIPDEVIEIISTMEVSSMDVDGHPVWFLSKEFTPQEIDKLFLSINESVDQEVSDLNYKPSDFVQNLKIELAIDKDSYYLRRSSIQGEYEVEENPNFSETALLIGGLPTSSSGGTFAFVVKLDDFGEEVAIETPLEFITIEEFGERLNEVIMNSFGEGLTGSVNPAEEFARTRDNGRESVIYQIGHATEAYYAVQGGKYPDPRTSSGAWITASLVKTGEMSSAPQAIAYESGGPCSADGPMADSENGWCYKVQGRDTAGPVVVYAAMESEESLSKCLVGFPWFVWSSADGRAGLVCSGDEPTAGAQEFSGVQ